MKSKLAALLLVAGTTLGLPVAGADMVNGIAALVGKSVITYEDVMRLISPTLQGYMARYANEPETLQQAVRNLQRQGLQTLIDRQLILQEFDDLKVNIPEPIIEDRIQARIKERYGDRVTLARTLREQGETVEGFRREERERLIEMVMVSRNLPRDILITPGRIERFYRENEEKYRVKDQVKLRMITIDRGRNPGDASRLGREILRKLDEGADFGEMASVYSDGSQAREGGLRGWEERSSLRDEIADVAFSLSPGKRSNLIETPEFVCIVKVEDLRPAYVRPLSEVREEIERQLIVNERARLERQWLERLRKKSFVRLLL